MPGRRSNVTYFRKLNPGDPGLPYSITCWLLLLFFKEREQAGVPSLWEQGLRKSFQLLISVTQIVFFGVISTNMLKQIAGRVSTSCALTISSSCVPIYFLITICYGPMLNDFCHYFLWQLGQTMIAKENYFMEVKVSVPKGRARPMGTWRAAQGTRCSQAYSSDKPGTYPHSSVQSF